MTRTLPADVARCPGYELDNGTLRDGCEDCLDALTGHDLVAILSRLILSH